MFHSAAVVGLNTSAMIEAAIVGRTVHTMLVPEFSSSQLGTLHFDYLLRVAGGLPRVAMGFDEHRRHLVDALHAAPEEGARRALPFLEQFVRPHGLDRPVTPIVVDEIERVAADGPRTVLRRRPLLGRALLGIALFGARVRARAGEGVGRKRRQAGEPA
jgi:hypothetical protein